MEGFFRYSLTFLLLLATFMECAQVLFRHFLQLPVMWLDESIIFPAIWLYMLGCANASRENSQIVAKILPAFFPGPRSSAIFDFCARFFSLIISVWLTWHALGYFFQSLKANRKTATLFLPIPVGEAAVAAGMILISCYCLLHLCRSSRKLCRIFGGGRKEC